jgi:ParB-like chromosome segregation protein Spo0J
VSPTAPLETTYVPLAELTPWPGNYREHDIGAICESLQRFGQQKPIVVQASSMRVVAGNGTYLGAQALGWSEIATYLTDLSDTEAEAFLLADNRTQERGSSRDAELADLLSRVAHRGELPGTGYDGDDVDDLLARVRRDQQPLVKPEIPFSTELLEEHQYVVLYFDNTLDWNMAVNVLGVGREIAPDATDTYQRIGVGRVLRGADVVKRIADAEG